MDPRHQQERGLGHAGQRFVPTQKDHARIGRDNAVKLVSKPRVDRMSRQQWWDGKAKDKLDRVARPHAQGAAAVQQPQRQIEVKSERAVKRRRADRVAPDRQEHILARIHRVEPEQAEGMIDQMGGHIGEQDQAGDQPPPAAARFAASADAGRATHERLPHRLFVDIGVLALAQAQADRHPGQIEGVAQAVDEVTHIGLGQLVGALAEQHEGRRP